MANEWNEQVPARTRDAVGELVSSLKAAFGEDLASVVLHGSAVRGPFDPETSDVDLVVVLKHDGGAKLDAARRAFTLARSAERIEAMILTKEEIARAADVFPLLYEDIGRHGVALHGEQLFSALTISHAHRRLRIEQELREARIRMRRVRVDFGDTPLKLAGALERKTKQLRSAFFSLLALKGTSVADSAAEVFRATASAYGVSIPNVLAPRANPTAAFDELAALLDKAIADVDAMESRGHG